MINFFSELNFILEEIICSQQNTAIIDDDLVPRYACIIRNVYHHREESQVQTEQNDRIVYSSIC